MSSGEQAVFPILYDFVRQEVARSIVLIDELELHLHPPEQQALLAALRRLGPDCQFIVTSHSPYLESVTPPEEEVRLKGGLRCSSPRRGMLVAPGEPWTRANFEIGTSIPIHRTI